MSCGPSARRDNSELIEDLTYDTEKSDAKAINEDTAKPRCPHIKVEIESVAMFGQSWTLVVT